MLFAELANPTLGGRSTSGTLGQFAEVDEQDDRAVVILGAFGSNQGVNLDPGLGLTGREFVEVAGSLLGMLLLESVSLCLVALGFECVFSSLRASQAERS